MVMAFMGALVLLALVQAAPALAAAANYTGGPQPGDYPLYVANDHSVYALRFTADAGSLLDAAGDPVATAGAQYYVKLRISPTGKPSGGTSRGFIWNAATEQWAQERASWSDFPVVTTGAGGAITAGNTWWYFKFGDTTKPGSSDSATWYVLVSLKPVDGADQTTQNNASPPPVTIFDMAGTLNPGTLPTGFRIHNGVPTGARASKRVEATSATGDVLSLSRTQDNTVTQGYGTTATGDFDLAVPVGVAFDAKIQDVIWPVAASSYTGSLANVDIALGASDTTPPAAPTSLTATAGDGQVSLVWPEVAGAASYTIYQWQDATPINGSINYTPQHLPVATVTTAGYDVTGLTNGRVYSFEVRANDEATNIGPPSAVQTVTPKAPAQLTLVTSATVVKWGGQATLRGKLTDGADPFAAGQQITVEYSFNGSSWMTLKKLDPSATFSYSVAVAPKRATMYRFAFKGDAAHAAVTSATVKVTPKVKLGKPVVPSSVKKGRAFAVYGGLTPKAAAGSKTVRIKCYLKQSGVWKLKKTVRATNRDYRSASRYSAKFSLRVRGAWRLVAVAPATSKFAKTTSAPAFVKVK